MLYNIFIWTLGIVIIVWIVWTGISFLRFIFGLGRAPEAAMRWDTEHLCRECGQPTVIMEFNTAIRLCGAQHGYWHISEHGLVWHHIDATMPSEYTISNN